MRVRRSEPAEEDATMAAMTSKERCLAAIRFEGPDRVPVSPRLWRYMLAHGGTQKTSAYLKYAEGFDFDPLLSLPAGRVRYVPPTHTDECDLGPDVRMHSRREVKGEFTIVKRVFETPAGRLSDEVHLPKPGGQFGIAPNAHIKEHIVKGPEDLPALEMLVQAWAKGCRIPDFRKDTEPWGRQFLVAANTYSALSHNAGDAYPIEQMMIDCFERPDFVNSLIDVFHRPLMEATRQALENGAEMVFCSTFFESMSSGWSPAIYREFFLPRIKEHVDLTHSYGVPYHLYDDGKVRESLPILHEIGIDLLSTVCPPPSGDITLNEARQVVGKDMCLNGGIDTVNTIWRGTPQDVDAAVHDAIDQAALPEGGYIVGTSDSITEEAPEENFAAFFKAARTYGKLSD
jgi:uroporphyrinogen decarboxylase